MNIRNVIYILGRLATVIFCLMFLPILVSYFYHEPGLLRLSFALPMVILLIFSYLASRLKVDDVNISLKEGMAIVAFSWVGLSLIGALPFVIAGEIPTYIDAFFETVSGLTTTGSIIITNVEEISNSLLFWRSFTHFIGGMGILVFALAVIPRSNRQASRIASAEVPGPKFGKLVPKLSYTARILYAIYFALFIILTLALIGAGMPIFDAILHGMGTAGTGGFGIKAASVGYYNSKLIHWIITIGMFAFGVNFNLYFLLLTKKKLRTFLNEEFILYAGVVLGAIAMIWLNTSLVQGGTNPSLTDISFSVSSVISTTGFSVVDFDQWPNASKIILLLLMFTGASTGSTAGGLKMERILILGKDALNSLKRMVNPRQAIAFSMNKKRLEAREVHSIKTYFVLYAFLFVLFTLLVSPAFSSFETTISAVATCFNNIGPGFQEIGPAGNFFALPQFTKVVLSVAMLFGRLELYPMLLLFSPVLWERTQ